MALTSDLVLIVQNTTGSPVTVTDIPGSTVDPETDGPVTVPASSTIRVILTPEVLLSQHKGELFTLHDDGDFNLFLEQGGGNNNFTQFFHGITVGTQGSNQIQITEDQEIFGGTSLVIQGDTLSITADDLFAVVGGNIFFGDLQKSESSFTGNFNLSTDLTDWDDWETEFGVGVPLLRAVTTAAGTGPAPVYLSARRDAVATTSPTAEFNPMGTTTPGGTITTDGDSGDITFVSTTGVFTIPTTGAWKFSVTLYLIQSTATLLDSFRLRRTNNTPTDLWVGSALVHNAVDPTCRSFVTIVDATAADTIEVLVDSNGASTLTAEVGCTVVLEKMV